MESIKELEKRVVACRATHLANLDKIIDSPDSMKQSEMTEMERESALSEAALDKAVVELMERQVADVSEPSGDTFQALASRASMSEYIRSAVSENPLAGAERELNEQLNGSADRGPNGGVRIPWRMLMSDSEARADVASSLPATSGPKSERDFIARVFRKSISMFAGVTFESVPVGQSTFTILTAGASASMKEKAGNTESVAATMSAVDLKPRRLSARYTIAVEDLSRSNLYETGLRRDLTGALRQEVDNQILNGSGSGAEFEGLLEGIADATGSTNNVTSFGDYQFRISGAVDGLHASELKDLRVIAAPDLFQQFINTYYSDYTDLTVLGWLADYTQGVKCSAHMPAADSTTRVTKLLVAKVGAMDGEPNACCAMWSSPELIRDPYTRAGRGQVNLTLHQLLDFHVLRPDAWIQRQVKIRA